MEKDDFAFDDLNRIAAVSERDGCSSKTACTFPIDSGASMSIALPNVADSATLPTKRHANDINMKVTLEFIVISMQREETVFAVES